MRGLACIVLFGLLLYLELRINSNKGNAAHYAIGVISFAAIVYLLVDMLMKR